MSKRPEFSVIVPVCHGGGLLQAALASARALEAGPEGYEVIVAVAEDDGASRRVVGQAGGAAVRCVPCASHNRSAMLNAAWRAARGRVLAFTDDDCAPPPGWLAALRAALAQAPGIVGGPDEHPGGGRPFDAALDWVLTSLVGKSGLRGDYPRLWNMALPGKVAHQVAIRREGAEPQLFDETLWVHEDVDLGERIRRSGRPIGCAPAARLLHARDTTFGSLLARNFGMARACRRLGVHRGLQGAVAATLPAGAALAVAAAFWRPAALALAACVAAYVAVIAACAIAAAAGTGRPAAGLWTAPLLVGLHLARAAGYLMPAGTGRQREG